MKNIRLGNRADNLFCGHCGARMDGDVKNTIATMISKEAEEHE